MARRTARRWERRDGGNSDSSLWARLGRHTTVSGSYLTTLCPEKEYSAAKIADIVERLSRHPNLEEVALELSDKGSDDLVVAADYTRQVRGSAADFFAALGRISGVNFFSAGGRGRQYYASVDVAAYIRPANIRVEIHVIG
ncbi:hypothetical protein HYU15_02290 [Candidatus Woesearchaeota archaeon]|nr:hypothetical protein [Candidatus Woesearchaeota archaeon]